MSSQPLASNAGPGYRSYPNYRITFTPSPKRIRASFAGETIVDSTNAMLLHETKHIPVYYFPRDDIRMDLLQATDHQTHCPFKGDAAYWSIDAGSRVAENAAWSYPAPYDEVLEIKDHVAFYWDRMDAWYEEDEEVFVHARDPHVRLDILPSSRPVTVMLGGAAVAESGRALFLFETGLPTRYYIPADDVRRDLLAPSATRTSCPYKGTARYWSADINGTTYDDIAWFYPEPVHEAARVRDHICFFNERVDEIRVDGQPMPKPRTKWS